MTHARLVVFALLVAACATDKANIQYAPYEQECLAEASPLTGFEPVSEAQLLDIVATWRLPTEVVLREHDAWEGQRWPARFDAEVTGRAERIEWSGTDGLHGFGRGFHCPAEAEVRLPIRLSVTLGDDDVVATLDTAIDASGPYVELFRWASATAPATLSAAWTDRAAASTGLPLERTDFTLDWRVGLVDDPDFGIFIEESIEAEPPNDYYWGSLVGQGASGSTTE